jgi:phosphate transport system substrate-binding protein
MKSVFKKLFLISAVAAIAVAGFTGCGKKDSKVIVINGSTTVNPIVQKASELYSKKHPNVQFSVKGTGSGDGIKSLINGTCEIAMASRKMKDKEHKMAKEKGLDVKEIAVGADMIVPIVHPDNSVDNLTTEQLKKIYTGDIKNWKEVGGEDSKIVVISRESSSGTFGVWNKKILEKKHKVRQDADYQKTNPGVAQTVAGNKQAIGYVGLGFVNPQVKAIDVNGVAPKVENSDKHPVARLLYLYVDTNKLSKEAQSFIDYIKSPEGQEIVKSENFIPLK